MCVINSNYLMHELNHIRYIIGFIFVNGTNSSDIMQLLGVAVMGEKKIKKRIRMCTCSVSACACVRMRACVHACVRACVRTCVRELCLNVSC